MEIGARIAEVIAAKGKLFCEENGFEMMMQINEGDCEAFREIAIGELEALHPEVNVRRLDSLNLETMERMCEEFGSELPSAFYEFAKMPHHAWFACEGRHYDAECLEGAESFLELPFFQYYREFPHLMIE